MKQISTIQALIKTLMNSTDFHALVIQSLPGWGKSTSIDSSLKELKIHAVFAGSYATPLHIYNMLCAHPSELIVFDDCAGLLNDVKTMAILKAATWHSSGPENTRRVTWGSTSDKVVQPAVDFRGKLILLTNTLPSGKETDAFLSRCLSYKMNFSEVDIREMLLSAARSTIFFSNSSAAIEVSQHLVNPESSFDVEKVNLRTLKMAYELAILNPDSWRDLLGQLVPTKKSPTPKLTDIFESDLSSREQEARFLATTGKSRRSYYYYKKRMGFTRTYRTRET